MKYFFYLLFTSIFFFQTTKSQTTLFPFGSSWKYLDNGSNQGNVWTSIAFNDASWSSGNGELGYGDGDEVTKVSYGPNSSNKYITTYFRKTIDLVSNYTSFTARVKRDDGIVVYVNNTEVYRNNILPGTVTYTTLGKTADDDGDSPQTFSISPGAFVMGENVIAVEIHQNAPTNSDISFDMELKASGSVPPPPPPVNILNYGETWKYLDNGADMGTSWKNPSFSDGSWATGNAELGYGDGDEATEIDYGNNANKKHITSYFRKTFSITDVNAYTAYSLNIKRDDGAVVYLNGNEVFRTNMPSGTIAYNTLAASDANDDGETPQIVFLNASQLNQGTNLLAVEVHQSAGNSPDLSFDLEIKARTNIAPTVSITSPLQNAQFSEPATIIINATASDADGTIKSVAFYNGNTLLGSDNSSPYSYSWNNVGAGNYTITARATDNVNAVTTSAPVAVSVIENTITGNMPTYGSEWKYLDDGTDQGSNWKEPSFNDALWESGNAELGYGDGDEETVVSYGPNASQKYTTTYFRKTFSIPDASIYSGYTLKIRRDDGAVVYINGVEVFRTNMPTGIINYNTLASAAASDDGETAQSVNLSPSQLNQGINVIAVEVHQSSLTNPDMSFDLELKGNTQTSPPADFTLTRGPYLNSALQTGIVIRWRTDVATDSKVMYGTTAGNLNQSVTDNTSTKEHIVTLTGLTTNTQYYYSIGSTAATLQGDASNYFKTMPEVGSKQKIRIMAMGDMGKNSTLQRDVRDAWLAFNGNRYTDAWILLGDNAYTEGTDAEYQTKFFNIYQGSLTKNHVLWPAPGNHDYASSSSRQADHDIPYYDLFTLPQNGEAGGVPSNSEAFYSYNYANVHFVSLDSYGWEAGNTRLYDTTGPQAVWLKQDLAANTQPWTVVYFHHPPYSKGSHNSDSESELYKMRERIVPILERYKVDLVLNGHSHSYERSFLLNGHYGSENTFSAANHALSTSSAKYDGSANSCTYIKNATNVRNGIVYAVVGTSGQISETSSGYPHNAMFYSNVSDGGLLYFEIEDNRLDAKWICDDGVIRDNFTIMKNVNKTQFVSIAPGSDATLTASWIGNYRWSNGATTRTITVSPSNNSTYSVSDDEDCLRDEFNITVSTELQRLVKDESQSKNMLTVGDTTVNVYPTVVTRGQSLHVAGLEKNREYFLVDISGHILRKGNYKFNTVINTATLRPGTYFIKWIRNNTTEVRKFIVIN